MQDSSASSADKSSNAPVSRSTGEKAVRLAQESIDRLSRDPANKQENVSAEDIAPLLALLTKFGSDSITSDSATVDAKFRLGRFEVLAERGRGGFGIVLRAFDPYLQRDVALKLPKPERLLDGDLPEEIVREARVAAQLEHPGIVPIYETGRWGPIWYIAAAYCEGPSLGDWLNDQQHALAAGQAVQLVAQVADAIHYAHTRGVLHLDLKPDNILMKHEAAASAELIPLITDFGLSGWSRGTAEASPTRIGGTPSYMAPEQVSRNLKEIGVGTDVFALGAILAELLSVSRQQPTAMRARRDEGADSLTEDVSPDLRAVVQKCLAPEAANRYASAKELADDLRRFLNGETLRARPVARTVEWMRWARRKPALAASLFVLATAIGVGLVSSTLLWRRAELNLSRFQQAARQRDQAERQIEQSVLNLAWVAQKSRLGEAASLANGAPDLAALESFLADMQHWRRQSPTLHANHVGIEAAMHSLALFDRAASTDDANFLKSYRQGLQCWQQLLQREPDQVAWQRALAAHLLTYHLRSASHDWLAWRAPAYKIDPAVIAVVELPYADLLVELSAFHLQSRRRSELCYSMLAAAIQIVDDRQRANRLPQADQRLLLQAHNLAASAANYSSRSEQQRIHRAAADQMVTVIGEPRKCAPTLAREVAITLAEQAQEASAAGESERSLALFKRAAEYLHHAVSAGPYAERDYFELVRLYSRMGRCHRELQQPAADDQTYRVSIELLSEALARSPQQQRVVRLRRGVIFCRHAQSLLDAGQTLEAAAEFEAATHDFTEAGLQRTDSKGTWLASILTWQALGKHYATVGRYAESRQAYDRSLQTLATMQTFTRHPSVAAYMSAAKTAIAALDESQGS